MTDPHPYDLVIGLDRADKKCDLCLIDTRTLESQKQTLSVAPEALFDWVHQLRLKYPTGRIAICLEQPASNLLAFLETYEFLTLYAINPVTLQKYREAFVTSRAKDDDLDAETLADLVLTHHAKLTPWKAEDPQTRLLGQLVIHRRAVVNERTELTNQIQAHLKAYYPQALELCGEELWRPLATSFLLKWPTLQAVRKARPDTLRTFYYRQGSRSETLIAERLEVVAQAVALTQDPGLLETYAMRVALAVKQLCLVVQAIKTYDKKIADLFAQHPDREIFRTLPGAGPIFAPRLLISMGARRERFQDNRSLQCFSGIAPVTKRSGKKCYVHRRYLCPVFVKQSFHEFAKQSIFHSRWAAAYYQQQRRRGSKHNTAVRALAYKWQRVIWKCWHDHTIYKEEIYEAALRRRNSPLVPLLEGIELGKFPVINGENNN